MNDLDISVVEVPESDWELWRDLRLDALRDAPGAFGETLAQAEARTETDWRARWQDEKPMPRFIADIDGVPSGMCSLALVQDHDYQPLLISMWTSPRVRGRGLGRALLDACVRWCAQNGHTRLHLGVVDDNDVAGRLYLRYGFQFTGHAVPLESDPSKLVKWMDLPIQA